VFTTSTGPAFLDPAYVERQGSHPLVRLFRWFAAYLRAGRIEQELNSLTDRELSDIGIARGDIHAVALGTYRRH
jgi:uncharacterized protein YjiS (DUF1127 family)